MRPIALNVRLVAGTDSQFEILFTDQGAVTNLTGKVVTVFADPPAGAGFLADVQVPAPLTGVAVVTLTGAQIAAGHADGKAWLLHGRLDGVTASLYSAMSRAALA